MSTEPLQPGPWRWVLSPKNREVVLSQGLYGDYVMGFRRWGMTGATPTFGVKGLMVPAIDLSEPYPGREHHADWCRTINHPAARLMEAAPTLLAALEDVARCMDAEPEIAAALGKAGGSVLAAILIAKMPGPR